jgi:ketosteroid isomerase-like protein
MPSREIIEAFVKMVESGQHDATIERFYTDDATMQENQAEPRRGRAALVAAERKMMASAKEIRSQCVRPVLIEGDTVVIQWIFEFDLRDGSMLHIEELAHQTWLGEQIARERFFYDSSQMKPVKRR